MTWLDEPELQPSSEQIAAAGQAAITYASPLVRALMIARKQLLEDLERNPEDAGMTGAELDDQTEALDIIIRSLLGRNVDDLEPISDDDWQHAMDWLLGQHGEVH